MKKCFYLSFFFGLVLILFSCATYEKKLQESGLKLLNQQELIELFKQERVATWKYKQESGKTYYFPNRTQKMTWSIGGGQSHHDEGEYRFKKGLFCSKWKETRDGKEKCFKLYHNGENKYVWMTLRGEDGLEATLNK